MRLHINEIIWEPTEIKLAMFQASAEFPEVVNHSEDSFSESRNVAPAVGLEPTTWWLTATRSAS